MKSRMSLVNEAHHKFGLYLWRMPNGSYVADEDGNFLNIASEYGDISKMFQLQQAAAYYGIFEGEAEFFPGHRRVSEEEYLLQKERLASGLVPDTEDVGSLIDDLRDGNSG